MRLLAVALFALAFSPGCGPDSPTARRELVVFAASSLAEAFAELEARFEAEHPGVDVICQLAGSQALGAQLEHGARADVFASADLEHVEALDRLGLVAETIPFATNELVLAVPRDRPLVTSVESLGDAE
ncbi:MAG: molybdate ABC transporter substrate-binding protein, partial [Polyangiaceae bacterium]|nr:molybdate ABC transporter substrate-binding protein [Polyangiaceae bacterium]